MADVKLRVLFLLRYLMEYSDEEHPVSTPELLELLKGRGFCVNRKTLKDDIRSINESGYEILKVKAGRFNSYYIGDRIFENPEIRILVDAVSSSRFISAGKSEELISKLARLTSRSQQKPITAKMFTADRLKVAEGRSLLVIDAVSRAIDEKKKIYFQYIDYLPTKEKVLAHDGETYVASPYALIWNDDRYYMAAYSEKHGDIISFRIDRMTVPVISDEEARADEGFNPAEYSRKMIKMYAGPFRVVTIRCENRLMKNVIDRYGEEIKTELDGDTHFKAAFAVDTSRTFYGWVFQFAGGIQIEGPPEVKSEYMEMLRQAFGEK